MPTNEDLIVLMQRVSVLEQAVATLTNQMATVQKELSAQVSQLSTLNGFYGGALQSSVNSLLGTITTLAQGKGPIQLTDSNGVVWQAAVSVTGVVSWSKV